jgi:hypothetical protein
VARVPAPIRFAGVVLGSLLLFPGLYGLIGLGVVHEQWRMCQRMAASAALWTSYPPDFCQARDWVAAALPGIGLISLGALGIALIVAGLRFR